MFQSVYSEAPAELAAVKDLKDRTAISNPKTIIYFASAKYAPSRLAAAMSSEFPGVPAFGCTTAGEIASGKMLKHSIVAMFFDQDAIEDVAIRVVENITADGVEKAMAAFADYYKTPVLAMDPAKYIGIVLFDGLARTEEKIMDLLGNYTNVAFVGGSAGDDLKFSETTLFANNKTYTNAVVLALLKPKAKFAIVKTQSVLISDKQLIATKVDEPSRVVMEFNNKPAIEAYAAALGVTALAAPNLFMKHPLGLVIDGEPFVRSPQKVVNRESIQFYCNIKEGTELAVLNTGDIVADTQRALQQEEAIFGPFKAIINFHCILRTLELLAEEKSDAYGQLFSAVPTIGFSTYGEAYIGHINQTSTMLVFG